MKSFILKGATIIPPEPPMPSEDVYDSELQIWVDGTSGIPVILSSMNVDLTRYGETTITETREGTDQTEVTSLNETRYGETTLTRTIEGADQSEIAAFSGSRFGETGVTSTTEGIDQSEVSTIWSADFNATHSHF